MQTAGLTAVALATLLMSSACGEERKPAPADVHVELVVYADGRVDFAGEHFKDHKMLAARLRVLTVRGSELIVHVTAEKTAPYETVADAMRILQASGVVHVGIIGTEQFVEPD